MTDAPEQPPHLWSTPSDQRPVVSDYLPTGSTEGRGFNE